MVHSIVPDDLTRLSHLAARINPAILSTLTRECVCVCVRVSSFVFPKTQNGEGAVCYNSYVASSSRAFPLLRP